MFPASAQSAVKQDQSLISYIPKKPNLKDEQNIDFLYNLYEVAKEQPSLSEALSQDVPEEALESRNTFSEYYYSPDKNAFKLREFMKLLRASSCKVSKLSGVRGIDLASKFLKADSQIDSPGLESLSLWKSTYEYFCPDLW